MKKVYSFANSHILVLGDSILDENIFCRAIGLSIETPTMKAEFLRHEITFGGAANVVNNLLSLGCQVSFISLISRDKYYDFFCNWKHENLNKIFRIKDGENFVKSRYWLNRGDRDYKYLQINHGKNFKIDNTDFEFIIEKIESIKRNIDLFLIIDYRNGFFSDIKFNKRLIQHLKKLNKSIVVNSQISDKSNNYSSFRGADCFCMNEDEAKVNSNSFVANNEELGKLADILHANVCVTLGDKGSILKFDEQVIFQNAIKVDPIDTCGAGDAFLAAFCSTYNIRDLEFCSIWAGLSTLKIGTNSPTIDELNEYIIKN